MDKILHDPKDLKLWELWYIPYYGSCRILSINRNYRVLKKVYIYIRQKRDILVLPRVTYMKFLKLCGIL